MKKTSDIPVQKVRQFTIVANGDGEVELRINDSVTKWKLKPSGGGRPTAQARTFKINWKKTSRPPKMTVTNVEDECDIPPCDGDTDIDQNC